MDKFVHGARVVFFGDSITANGTWMRRILEYYRKNTDIRFELYNAGVSGDNATNASVRIYEDVLYHEPTDVVMMFGMNDVCRGYYAEGASTEVATERRACLEACIRKIKELAYAFQRRGIRVILASPTPYDELAEIPQYNYIGVEAALYEIGDRLNVFAKKNGIPFVAFNSLMLPILKKEYKSGKSFIGPDRVHPTPAGHELMAALFLREQGFEVEIPETVEKMTELSRRPFDEWEERRYFLECRITPAKFIDRCLFTGIKDSQYVLKYTEEKLAKEATDYQKSCAEAYKEYVHNKDAYVSELNEHTRTVYGN